MPGMERTGRTLANRSSFLRSATLTLVYPPPTGVVTGPFNPTWVRSRLSMHVRRQGLAGLHDQVGVQLGHFPIDADSGCIHRAARRRGDLGSNTVARDQGNFMRHRFIVSGVPKSEQPFNVLPRNFRSAAWFDDAEGKEA